MSDAAQRRLLVLASSALLLMASGCLAERQGRTEGVVNDAEPASAQDLAGSDDATLGTDVDWPDDADWPDAEESDAGAVPCNVSDCALAQGPCQAAGACNDDGACSYPSLPNGTPCDDGDDSTTGDICLGGVCNGQPAVVSPPDTCVPCDGCPIAVIELEQPDDVAPQTVLAFDGSSSFGNSAISTYSWTVEQPAGSQSVLTPFSTSALVWFEANVAGVYTFKLNVHDLQGRLSCAASRVVTVTPVAALHIELTWDTPSDPDQTDTTPLGALASVGTDLDLHFLHPAGADYDANEDGISEGWFHPNYDTYWANVAPAGWVPATNPATQPPSLDRDDTDGAGPENLNFAAPTAGFSYRVGVHSWEDHGFGNSIAMVRIYLDGALAYEAATELANHDMWTVATIDWPSGVITPAADCVAGACDPDITIGYWPSQF